MRRSWVSDAESRVGQGVITRSLGAATNCVSPKLATPGGFTKK